MENQIAVAVTRTATYTVTVIDERKAIEAFKPVAVRMKKKSLTVEEIAEAVANCYFASDHAYNTHMYGVGLLRDPNLGISISLNSDEAKATIPACTDLPSDICPVCGKKQPLVAEFGMCGMCAQDYYDLEH